MSIPGAPLPRAGEPPDVGQPPDVGPSPDVSLPSADSGGQSHDVGQLPNASHPPADGAAIDPPPEDGSPLWRPVSKATPFIQAWKAIAVIAGFILYQGLDDMGRVLRESRAPIVTIGLWALGIIAVIGVVTLIYSWFAWRNMRYAVGRDAVYLHTGIMFKKQRHARLNRIQSVEIQRPLLGRMFGLSGVQLESAGAGDSSVKIEYLKEDEAERLRAEVLGRAAGLVEVSWTGGEAGDPTELPIFRTAPEREVIVVPTGRLLGSILLSWYAVAGWIAVAGILIGVFTTDVWELIFGIGPLGLVFAVGLYSQFAMGFNFTLAISPDGLRTRTGLLSTRAQTLPPKRVHAIRISQPLLWRPFGWWHVDMNIAGWGPRTGENADAMAMLTRMNLLPVGTREEALRALWLVAPDLGVADPNALLAAALDGRDRDGGFIPSPRSARWLDWISWRRRGVLATRTLLVIRQGRLERSVTLVPHERTQSLGLTQGPLQRAFGLATLRAHTVIGAFNPTAAHLDHVEAGLMLAAQAQRARVSRASEGPDEWMRRVGPVAPIMEQ